MAVGKAAIPQDVGQDKQQPRLDNLIPIAVAIACGCASCVESTIVRASRLGSPRQDLEETLRIVSYMLNLECLALNAGADAVARMQDALNAAAEALRQTAIS